MYFLRARYLNTEIGRFHTRDSFEGVNIQPFSLHKYLYANSNPVMNIDPSGHLSLAELQSNLAAFSNLLRIAAVNVGRFVALKSRTSLLNIGARFLIRTGQVTSKFPSSARLIQRTFNGGTQLGARWFRILATMSRATVTITRGSKGAIAFFKVGRVSVNFRRFSSGKVLTIEIRRLLKQAIKFSSKMTSIIGVEKKDFIQRFGTLMRGVFRSFDVEEGIFAKCGWGTLFFPYDLFLEDEEIKAFVHSLNSVGDSHFLMINIEALPIHNETVIIPLTDDFPERLEDREEIDITIFSSALFGPSGKWGMIFDRFYEYRLLGGDEEFMHRFLLQCGGLEKVVNEFKAYAENSWIVEKTQQRKILAPYKCGVSQGNSWVDYLDSSRKGEKL